MKFKLLQPLFKICGIHYVQGDVIESSSNLAKTYNDGEFLQVFERVPENTPVSIPKGKFKFKLLTGIHVEAPFLVPDGQGNVVPDHFHPGREYHPGDIIETDDRIDYLFDKTSYAGNRKFELLNAPTAMTREELIAQQKAIQEQLAALDKVGSTDPATPSFGSNDEAALESMTVEELKKFASEEGINLGTLNDKKKIIDKIKVELEKLAKV